jgi:hypothetical protein
MSIDETLPNFTKGKHPRKGKKMKQGGKDLKVKASKQAQVEHVLVANESKEVGHKEARESTLSINT